MELLLLLLFILAFMALAWTGPNPLAGAARWGGVVGRALVALRLRRAPQTDAWVEEMTRAARLSGADALEAAVEAYERAIEAAAAGPEPATRRARALAPLVWLHLQLGQTEEARARVDEMQAMIDAGSISLVTHFGSDLHEFRAVLHRIDDRPAAAETHLRTAIRIEEKLGGPCSPALRTALGELAGLYRRRHHYAAAAATLERMLRLEYPDPEENARARREARLDLGSLELARDNGAAAEAHFSAVVEELEGPAPAEWRRLSNALHGLAEVQMRAGHFAEAEDLVERALKLCRASDPDNRVGLLPLLDARARVYARSGRIEEAESVRREILIITQGAFGHESARLAEPLEELADLKVRQQRPDEAMPLIEQASRLLWQSGGVEQAALGEVLHKQAALLQTAGYRLQAEGTRAAARDIGRRLAHRWDGN